MHKSERLYDALRQGEFIETNDLIHLKTHFENLAVWCDQLGPRFRLPANEAHSRADQINGYLANRARP